MFKTLDINDEESRKAIENARLESIKAVQGLAETNKLVPAPLDLFYDFTDAELDGAIKFLSRYVIGFQFDVSQILAGYYGESIRVKHARQKEFADEILLDASHKNNGGGELENG